MCPCAEYKRVAPAPWQSGCLAVALSLPHAALVRCDRARRRYRTPVQARPPSFLPAGISRRHRGIGRRAERGEPRAVLRGGHWHGPRPFTLGALSISPARPALHLFCARQPDIWCAALRDLKIFASRKNAVRILWSLINDLLPKPEAEVFPRPPTPNVRKGESSLKPSRSTSMRHFGRPGDPLSPPMSHRRRLGGSCIYGYRLGRNLFRRDRDESPQAKIPPKQILLSHFRRTAIPPPATITFLPGILPGAGDTMNLPGAITKTRAWRISLFATRSRHPRIDPLTGPDKTRRLQRIKNLRQQPLLTQPADCCGRRSSRSSATSNSASTKLQSRRQMAKPQRLEAATTYELSR